MFTSFSICSYISTFHQRFNQFNLDLIFFRNFFSFEIQRHILFNMFSIYFYNLWAVTESFKRKNKISTEDDKAKNTEYLKPE